MFINKGRNKDGQHQKLKQKIKKADFSTCCWVHYVLGNLLTGKDTIKAGEGTIGVGQIF